MQPKTLVMYIVDDNIIIWNNKEINVEKISKKAIYFGKIYNASEFIKSFNKIIKKLKLNKGILNYNVTVVTNPNYTSTDIEVLKYCLEKLSYNKITFINITKFYKLNRNNMFIMFNNTYIFLTILNYKQKVESIFIDYKLFLNNIDRLAKYLSEFIKDKKILLIGYNDDIELLANKIEELTNTKTYYIDNPNMFIFNKMKNTLCK